MLVLAGPLISHMAADDFSAEAAQSVARKMIAVKNLGIIFPIQARCETHPAPTCQVHFPNHQSRRAIERIGAKLDGVLRHHMRTRDGRPTRRSAPL